MDISKIRKDFPILTRKMSDKPLVYLDNGATTLKPQPVIDAVVNYYTYLGANAHRGDYEMSAQVDAAFEGARVRTQKFLNAKYKEEIVFTSGSSEGLNLVAMMVTNQLLHEGDVILSDESEHASSILPWMQAGKKKGTKIDYIPLDEDGKITVENFKSVLTDKVKVVAIAMVSNVLGFVAPVKEIAKICHERGILLVIDGAQSTPHLDIDVQDLDCDFYAFSAHKMCGPTGVGALYGKKKWLDQLEPIFYGGESNARFDKTCSLTLKETPLKFESGTQPIEGVIGMAAAMDYLDAIGKENIHAHEVELKEYFLEKAKALGNIVVYNENAKSGIVTFNVKDKDQMIFAQDVASYLNTFGIAVRSGQHCAKLLPEVLKTPGTCRASFYLYNTKEEVDQLIDALKNATVENCVSIFCEEGSLIMSNIDPMLMRQIIMDHYDYPRNKKLTDKDGYMSRHMASDSCIDDITVQTKISNGKIDDVRFDGVACTISTASTSIMSELLKGKTTQEAKEIMDNYFKMIDQKEYDEDVLDEAIAFQNVGKQANRINCATIGWKAMREMIKESEDGKNE